MDIFIPVAAISALAIVLALGLAIVSVKFEVKQNPKIEQVRSKLPGANCGACGFSGCDQYAEAVGNGEAEVNKCSVGGAETADEIAVIMGVDAAGVVPMLAKVMCMGTSDTCKIKFDYSGIEDCAAAAALHSGPLECTFGCVGIGNCTKACPFGAIVICNGTAVVKTEICRGCGKCISACPKKIIKMVPKDTKYSVVCSNKLKGKFTAAACNLGCIGCKRCEKVCEAGAIKVENDLAVINYELCTGCGKCAETCTRKIIKLL